MDQAADTLIDHRGAENPARDDFYRDVLQRLKRCNVPYAVGGAYAFARVTGISGPIKDLDLFVRRVDLDAALECVAARGYATEVIFPHWLAKVRYDGEFIDLIFNSGNGISPVDDEWIARGLRARVLGVDVRLCPIEETIWTKAFVMERERYDGADVAHLIFAHAERIDWARLIQRFGADLPVLLCHLVLFGYIYPGERHRLPAGLLDDVIQRVRDEFGRPADAQLCRGGLLSRTQYLVDLCDWGYRDVRQQPSGHISAEDLAAWTAAAPERPHASSRAELD
jgi:hypothetical protein